MGTFIFFCLVAIVWMHDRGAQKRNRMIAEQRRKELEATYKRLGLNPPKPVIIARITITIDDENPW